jgi:hypothetical protein
MHWYYPIAFAEEPFTDDVDARAGHVTVLVYCSREWNLVWGRGFF